jgi:hypothetical protein
MPGGLSLSIFVLAILVFLGWFAVGTQVNVRKGERVLRWLQEGLAMVGEKTTLRWLGSSAVELKVQKVKKPFRQLDVFIVLEPRDVPFLWWFFRARGRRDLFIVRSQVVTPPAFELEAIDKTAWSTRSVGEEVRRKHWAWTEIPAQADSQIAAYTQGPKGLESAADLMKLATLPGSSLVRLAVHAAEPNLEVQWRLLDLASVSANQIFERVIEMAKRI